MGLHIKNRTLLCLSIVSLLLAGSSLALHCRGAHTPFVKRILSALSLTDSWKISWMGFVVAVVQLAMASRSYRTTLFQITLLMPLGWGMLLKADDAGLYHNDYDLAVSAALAVFALYSLYANVHGKTHRTNPPTKSGIHEKSSGRVSNPANGLGYPCSRAGKTPSKSHRHSTNCVFSRQDSIPPLDHRGRSLDQCVKDPPVKIQAFQRDSAVAWSKTFTMDPSTRPLRPGLRPALGLVPEEVTLPDEVVLPPTEPLPDVPKGQSAVRRISSQFQQAITQPLQLVQSADAPSDEITSEPPRLGWLTNIGRLLTGLFLGAILLIVMAGFVVALDHLYPMRVLTDFARIFRRNYATVVDMWGVEWF